MPSKDSKSNFALLRNRILEKEGKDYWRSVEEFVDAPEFEEFVKREYPTHAEEWEDGLSRRNFIKVMGASLAFAGLTGCVIQPAEKIVPYVRQPEDLVPGKPLFYATAMTLGGIATGLLARSYEGRPTKIEGNVEHPGSLGATDVRAQASLLDMYDPDRSQEVTFRGNPTTWENFITQIRARIDENRVDGGAGIRFLTETVTSPTLIAQFRQIFNELPNARLYQYEPVNQDNATAGAKMAFGSPIQTIYKFDQATRILSLDKDIFSDFNVRYMKDYAKGRAYSEEKKEINRLYAIETTVTLTGAKADHRLSVKPSQMPEIARAIAGALGVSGAATTGAGLTPQITEWIQVMARDLQANRGKSIVTAGDNQPPIVHALAHAINSSLGNVGTTVTYVEPFQPNAETLQIDGLRQLTSEIDAGAVKMLVILSGNPAYNTPADLRLDLNRFKINADDNEGRKVPLRVHLGHYANETSEICHWHIPEKHFLEMWSDTRAYDGTASIVQPLIAPLYDGKNSHEVVQLFARENYDKKDYDIVREYWQQQGFPNTPRAAAAPAAGTSGNTQSGNQGAPNASQNSAQTLTSGMTQQTAKGATAQNSGSAQTSNNGGQNGGTNNAGQNQASTALPRTTAAIAPAGASNFDDVWRKVIHDGVVPNSAANTKSVSASTGFLGQPVPVSANNGGLEIAILPDPSVYDGRFANNGWLQEVPNPLTKVTWDNVALISPRTAERLGVNQGHRDPKEQNGAELGTTFFNTKGGNLFSDLVTLEFQGGQIQKPVPMWIAPGQPDDVITIYLGYGRTRAGRVGTGLGYNAYDVLRSDAMSFGTGNIPKTGGQMEIASAQTHFNMEGRELLRVWEVESVEAIGEKVKEEQEEEAGYDTSMYPKFEYNGNKWGMSVDLNSCVGCNACVVACQSENNIPVVGKEQVGRGREMHWMRIDTYFGGDDINDPQGPHFQPVLCQQCEQAPCETVCPVHATVH
ncbi:MAG TPA: TAT-variant-translocated molybdopterin oxidoreductase, partial [Pyrinomonadaceae bacterium]|nr:TAT-variant-translocated molybdopterin oxidoreductase [Pyrinomonadaceae bacterium]